MGVLCNQAKSFRIFCCCLFVYHFATGINYFGLCTLVFSLWENKLCWMLSRVIFCLMKQTYQIQCLLLVFYFIVLYFRVIDIIYKDAILHGHLLWNTQGNIGRGALSFLSNCTCTGPLHGANTQDSREVWTLFPCVP